jgi:hypothetical protein
MTRYLMSILGSTCPFRAFTAYGYLELFMFLLTIFFISIFYSPDKHFYTLYSGRVQHYVKRRDPQKIPSSAKTPSHQFSNKTIVRFLSNVNIYFFPTTKKTGVYLYIFNQQISNFSKIIVYKNLI